ncbi:MAG: hypothetical protein ACE5KU_05815, partial [Nitrososphaerales archaeon]
WDCNEAAIQREDDDTFTLRAFFTPEMPNQHTYVIMRMVEGLLNSSGYAILRYTVETGYLALIFKCVPLPEEQPDQSQGLIGS